MVFIFSEGSKVKQTIQSDFRYVTGHLRGHDNNERLDTYVRGSYAPDAWMCGVGAALHPHKVFFEDHKMVLWDGMVVWIALGGLRWWWWWCGCLLWGMEGVVNIIPGFVVREG